MTILWVMPVVPFPVRDGGTIRLYQLLKGLTARHRVHLFALSSDDVADTDLHRLRDLCDSIDVFLIPSRPTRGSFAWLRARWSSVLGPDHLYHYAGLQQKIDDLCGRERVDVVMLETLKMAGYRPSTGASSRMRMLENVILMRHNYEPDLARRLARVTPTLSARAMWRVSEWLLTRAESRVVPQFKFITAVSEHDAAKFRRLAPQAHVTVVPNGADPIRFAPTSSPSGDHTVMIIGTMEYEPNRDSARFFCREIWPQVLRCCPRARLRIVGNAASLRIQELAGEPGVSLCEPGAEIAAELANATIVAVPLRIGAGTRIKILEALAAGKPVVSTQVGCEGLGLIPGRHLMIADTADAFATQVVELLGQPDLRARLGQEGRQLIEQKYSWRSAVEQLEVLCERVVRARPA